MCIFLCVCQSEHNTTCLSITLMLTSMYYLASAAAVSSETQYTHRYFAVAPVTILFKIVGPDSS